jgi:hypothetical protein
LIRMTATRQRTQDSVSPATVHRAPVSTSAGSASGGSNAPGAITSPANAPGTPSNLFIPPVFPLATPANFPVANAPGSPDIPLTTNHSPLTNPTIDPNGAPPPDRPFELIGGGNDFLPDLLPNPNPVCG